MSGQAYRRRLIRGRGLPVRWHGWRPLVLSSNPWRRAGPSGGRSDAFDRFVNNGTFSGSVNFPGYTITALPVTADRLKIDGDFSNTNPTSFQFTPGIPTADDRHQAGAGGHRHVTQPASATITFTLPPTPHLFRCADKRREPGLGPVGPKGSFTSAIPRLATSPCSERRRRIICCLPAATPVGQQFIRQNRCVLLPACRSRRHQYCGASVAQHHGARHATPATRPISTRSRVAGDPCISIALRDRRLANADLGSATAGRSHMRQTRLASLSITGRYVVAVEGPLNVKRPRLTALR